MKRTITQKELAGILGVKRSNLSEMLSGKLGLGRDRSARLEQITGIGIRTWLFGTPDEIKRELEKVYGKINFKRGRLPKQREVKK